jgi:adenylate cyclase
MTTFIEQELAQKEPARVSRAVVFVDVVESVRLMQDFESDVIQRWRRFVHEVRDEIVPPLGGRMVKSVGDGMLLEFLQIPAAAQAAQQILRRIDSYNADRGAEARIHLRLGAHFTDVVVEDFDVLGKGVNVAARLLSLARPGEAVVSAEFRAGLVPGLDGEIEDLGECFLKHVSEPVRAFRVRGADTGGAKAVPPSLDDLARPILVVAPFGSVAGNLDEQSIAAAFTDNLVLALSRLPHWTVISRMATAAMQGRKLGDRDIIAVVRARYLIKGTIAKAGSLLKVRLTIVDGPSGDSLFEMEDTQAAATFLAANSESAARLLAHISAVILSRELQVAHEAALPNVPAYTLLLHSVSKLHSMARADVARAREGLEHIVDRHPRSAEALAWLANWHFVQIAQASVEVPANAAAQARSHLARALDERPDHALSLSLEGHLLSYVDHDSQRAEAVLRRAVQHGPNESLAWLFLANLLTHTNRGAEAATAVRRADRLSPMDPLGYLYDLIAAGAHSAAGHYGEALSCAERSVRANALHLSSWVQLIIAQVQAGHMDGARTSARRYMTLRPSASVARFLESHPARGTPLADSDGQALLTAGLPL